MEAQTSRGDYGQLSREIFETGPSKMQFPAFPGQTGWPERSFKGQIYLSLINEKKKQFSHLKTNYLWWTHRHNVSMDFASDVLAWDQAPQLSGEKRQITKIGKILKSKASIVVVWAGGNGSGAWIHAFDAAIPWYQILVSCSDWSNVFMLTDSQCGWQYCALSMSHSCYFGRRFFKTQILSKQYKFLCKTFRLSLLQEE